MDVLLRVGDDLLGPVLHQVVQQDERLGDSSPVSRRRVDRFPHDPHYRDVAARSKTSGETGGFRGREQGGVLVDVLVGVVVERTDKVTLMCRIRSTTIQYTPFL